VAVASRRCWKLFQSLAAFQIRVCSIYWLILQLPLVT